MKQYIKKSDIVAEIERRIKERDFQMKSGCWISSTYMYEDLLDFINTLEVKEVLEKELSYKDYIGFFKEHPNFPDDWGFDECWVFAKYFYELGLKAKDWEKERMEECPYRQVGCTMYEGKILECRGACSWVVDYLKLKELKAQKGE